MFIDFVYTNTKPSLPVSYLGALIGYAVAGPTRGKAPASSYGIINVVCTQQAMNTLLRADILIIDTLKWSKVNTVNCFKYEDDSRKTSKWTKPIFTCSFIFFFIL